MPSPAKGLLLLIFALALTTHCTESEDSFSYEDDGMFVENSGEEASKGTPDLAYQVSDCGGFQAADTSDLLLPLSDPESSYCDAEVLEWYFNSSLGKLHLNHKRVPLNCCGEHSVRVKQDDNTLIVTEKDAPVNEDERCRCMCVFDFVAAIELAESQAVNLVLELNVTDQDTSPRQIYAGELNLQDIEGTIVLNKQYAMGCE